MALTATAQSALPLTWDETIVPALRKRLESESLILAKRMSTASMTSIEELYPNPDSSRRQRNASPIDYGRATSCAGNGTSKQPVNGMAPQTHQRTDTIESSISGSRGAPRRTRTYSQPYAYNAPSQNGHAAGGNGIVNGLPTPDSSRSTSPLYQSPRTSDVKPTRIPVVVRGRTPSMSSYSNGRTGDVSRSAPYYSPPAGVDLWAVEEAEPSNTSRSTISIPHPQPSGILNEPKPFKSASSKASAYNQYDLPPELPPPRRSTDSEERPFEHWYRGDVHRNGGVGELRVGAKQEMLDIANYGHRFGGKSNASSSARTPLTSRGAPVAEDFPARRKRVGSFTDMSARESFYMDEERARELANVLHEDPLTDLEGDGDPDTSGSFTEHDSQYINGYSSTSTPPPMSSPDDHRSVTPTNNRSIERERDAPPTRIPGPTPRQSSEPAPQATPTKGSYRGASEPPEVPSSSSTFHVPGRPQVTRSTSTPPEAQARGKSPPAASVSALKKPKPKASKSPSRLKIEDEKNRRSVAVYPEPTGDNMMDAIPSWTQPTGGNWDEVVLPVVARKKGLDEHYEQADGGPQPKKFDNRVEPAPGTFGYDHSKYRPPRDKIPMDEFGQLPTNVQDTSIAETLESADGRGRQSITKEDDPRPAYVRPPASPAPFSQYAVPNKVEGVPNILVTRPTIDEQDENDAGCCKCVIM